MISSMDIPAGLYEDDVVCYLAERYSVTTRDVVRRFLVQEAGDAAETEDVGPTFRLEDNEMEMLRGLTRGR